MPNTLWVGLDGEKMAFSTDLRRLKPDPSGNTLEGSVKAGVKSQEKCCMHNIVVCVHDLLL